VKIVEPSYEILTMDGPKFLETAGRTCYKSLPKGDPEEFIRRAIRNGHETIIEHGGMSVKFVADRGFSHELVRHRMAVYSQESTRWCNYKGCIEIIHPPGLTKAQKVRRDRHFFTVQTLYETELSEGLQPEIARGILPHALKTEIVITANYREWRLIFKQRAIGTTGRPHPQMAELMRPLMHECQEVFPAMFGDLG